MLLLFLSIFCSHAYTIVEIGFVGGKESEIKKDKNAGVLGMYISSR